MQAEGARNNPNNNTHADITEIDQNLQIEKLKSQTTTDNHRQPHRQQATDATEIGTC